MSSGNSFVAKYGDLAVELDALPLPVLQQKIRDSIESNLDMSALSAVRVEEEAERERLRKWFA